MNIQDLLDKGSWRLYEHFDPCCICGADASDRLQFEEFGSEYFLCAKHAKKYFKRYDIYLVPVN